MEEGDREPGSASTATAPDDGSATEQPTQEQPMDQDS